MTGNIKATFPVKNILNVGRRQVFANKLCLQAHLDKASSSPHLVLFIYPSLYLFISLSIVSSGPSDVFCLALALPHLYIVTGLVAFSDYHFGFNFLKYNLIFEPESPRLSRLALNFRTSCLSLLNAGVSTTYITTA